MRDSLHTLPTAPCEPLGPWYVGAAWAVLIIAAIVHVAELRQLWRLRRR